MPLAGSWSPLAAISRRSPPPLFLASAKPPPRHLAVTVIGSDRASAGASRPQSDSGDVASLGRDRFDKIIAIAVNPATYEEEAITALRKARELVKENRALAHPAAPAPAPAEPSYCFQVAITNIPPDWITLIAHSLSKEAYGLGLKSKIEYDFSDIPLALNVRADGCKDACSAFEKHFTRLMDFVNSQEHQPKTCTVRSFARW